MANASPLSRDVDPDAAHADGSFDYVIVGGGSAGCVLANRLSADPHVRVALMEAGIDTPPGAVPPEIDDSYPMPLFHGPRYVWPDLLARATAASTPKLYEQGRVMGGGSSINVQSANRGLPRDYDGWAEMGARGWSWSDVLPYFRKLETDAEFGQEPMHGNDGPLAIRRIMPPQWPALCREFGDGLRASDVPLLRDQNGEFGDGYFATPFSNKDDRRASAASAYLDAAVRRRPNLRIFSQKRVTNLVVDAQRRVHGVVARDSAGDRLVIYANETVLCAGAIQSPALLMRAGIGDGAALQALGIPLVHHLPGVGQNLQDHPALTFCHYLPAAMRAPHGLRRATMAGARLSAGVDDDRSDLYLSCATRAGWHALGERFALFFLWCNRPASRGAVRLASPDPLHMPEVDLNLLADPRDTARLAAGMQWLARIIDASTSLRASDVFPASFSPAIRKLSAPTSRNARLTALMGAALDMSGPAPLRRAILRRCLAQGTDLATLLAPPHDAAGGSGSGSGSGNTALTRFIETNVFGVWHASGTCRMGPAGAPDAVTDTAGRVHGVQALRVVDASLMPRLPTANTNIPTLMMAEKIASTMLASRAGAGQPLDEHMAAA